MCKTPIDAPPCVRLGEPLNPCARARYEEQILKNITLRDEWQGWKFRGRELVSPDGDRITPERLRGILYREIAEKSKTAARKQKEGNPDVKTQIIELGKYRKESK